MDDITLIRRMHAALLDSGQHLSDGHCEHDPPDPACPTCGVFMANVVEGLQAVNGWMAACRGLIETLHPHLLSIQQFAVSRRSQCTHCSDIEAEFAEVGLCYLLWRGNQ